jgi:hypothetical protein
MDQLPKNPSLSTTLSFSTANSSMSDDDTIVMDEDYSNSSVISSPPRSAKTSRALAPSRGNLLFPSGNNNEDCDAGRRSPIASPRNGIKKAKTPKSRRLFDDDDDVHVGGRGEDLSESLQDLLGNFSPPHPAYTGNRRYTLKPLDLNHHELTTSSSQDASLGNAPVVQHRVASSYRRRSGESQDSTRNEAQRRKRTSPGPRRPDAPRTPYRTNNLFQSGDSGAAMMMSPHISPNSFLTMDGRFVHSKNPFSSPMMTDEDNLTPRPAPVHHSRAPAFPLSFPSSTEEDDDDDGMHHARLPPRSTRTGASLTSPPPIRGFPESRFSFTGSPIPEMEEMDTHNALEDTDNTASCGSLHKVRRLTKQDDVVAATGQYLRMVTSANNNHPYYPRHGGVGKLQRPPAIDTSNNTKIKSPWDDHEDVSPTDVTSFPPPTPSKSRREPPQPPYAQLRNIQPSTPARPSRQSLQSHSPCHERTASGSKSRFNTDFDVIGELGKGSFGLVMKVLSRLDGCMYAIKAAHRPAKGQTDKDRMLKEVRLCE